MKNLNHRFLALLIATLVSVAGQFMANAQGDAMLTHFWAVPTYYNPGAAGDTDNIRLRGGTRLQWLGISGAPKSFIASGDMPFKFLDKRWGVGTVMQQESMGLFRNFSFNAQLGYKAKLFGGLLGVAGTAGFQNVQFRGTEVDIPSDNDFHQPTDDAIPSQDVAGYALDLGVGAYYVHKYFKAGIAALHLNSPTINFTTENGSEIQGSTGANGETAKKYEFVTSPILNLTAEGNIPMVNTLYEVMPFAIVRTDLQFTNFALGARVRYNKFLSGGLSYRSGDAVSLMLGAELKGVFVSYSYDYSLSAIARATSGSHELFAGYNLKLDFSEKNRNKHKSIRIM